MAERSGMAGEDTGADLQNGGNALTKQLPLGESSPSAERELFDEANMRPSESFTSVLSERGPKPVQSITALQAGWNVTNAIQGMFVVSFPYAVVQGGYWALIAMAAVAYICCHTGLRLIECLYEGDPPFRIRSSYVEIAESVWGTWGGRIVNVAMLIELLMTCILYQLLCGELLMGSFGDATKIDLASWTLISAIPLLPCALLKTFRHVSWLSFWCTVAHMAINGIIIVYCMTMIHQWQWGEVTFKIDIWTFPTSLGVVVFSYTSQIFLPSLEANMEDPKHFGTMLNWTHIAAAVFKVAFAWIGFLTWAWETQEVITNNLPTQALKILLNMILLVKAVLSYPLPYFAAVELFEATFCTGTRTCWDVGGSLKMWAVMLRVLLILFILVLAVFVPHFSLLMGFIGSFTGTMLSLVWPCWFHLKLRGDRSTFLIKLANVATILFGFFCATIGIYYTGHALMRAFHGLAPDPFLSPAETNALGPSYKLHWGNQTL